MTPLAHSRQGVTILEIMVSATILALAFSSLYALYGQGLSSLRITNQETVAQSILLARADRLREMGWSVLSGTDPTSISAVMALTDPTSLYRKANFPRSTEIISAYAYCSPAASGSTATYTITSLNSAAPVLSPSAFTTGTNSSIKWVIHLDWNDSHSKSHTREISTVLTKSGS